MMVLVNVEMQCTSGVNIGHILEPICRSISPKPSGYRWNQLVIEEEDLLVLSKDLKCRVNSCFF